MPGSVKPWLSYQRPPVSEDEPRVEADDEPTPPSVAYEPDDFPHPVRAQDVSALIQKIIG